MSGESDFLSDLGGAVRRRVAGMRKRVALPGGKQGAAVGRRAIGGRPSARPTGDRVLSDAAAAHIQASANLSAVEQMRPNAVYSLITSTPATAISAATSTGPLKIDVKGEAFISSFKATAGDALDFLITRLNVNGFDIIKTSSGVNLAVFLSDANRVDSPVPLVGRRFPDGVTIEAEFLNTNAAAKVWHGLAVTVVGNECVPNAKKTLPSPFMFDMTHVTHALRTMFGRRK